MELIKTIVPLLLAAMGLVWAISSYLDTQRKTLALERTKFIFENLRFLETDKSMQSSNKIIYGLATDFTIETFLSVMKSKAGSDEQKEMCMAMEGYLNFIWRIAYACIKLGSIKVEDLDAFGFYFHKISSHVGLREYCINEGFEDIIDAAEKLRPLWNKAERRNAAIAQQ